jgi:gas vesicle protein
MSDEVQDEIDRTEGSNTLAWFLTGAIIGATVAILYAPKSGKDTRQFISSRTTQSRDAINDTSKDIVDASKEVFERGRKLVEDAAALFERGRKLVKG